MRDGASPFPGPGGRWDPLHWSCGGEGDRPLAHLQSALALGFVSCPPHLGEGMWHGEGVWGCGGRKISHKIKFYSKITK